MPDPLLSVQDLNVSFSVPGGTVRAVRGVDLEIGRGEILGLVGETGSGKTTVGKAVARLIKPTSGSIRLGGREISNLTRRAMRPLRRSVQMVFQDPYSSLNPRMTIGALVGHPLRIHRIGSSATRDDRVQEVLGQVGLSPSVMSRYPGELSGGQRQRVGLARALVLSPQLLVADEPVSALDVSVQASILNLLVDLQRDLGFSCLFITHDLGVAEHLCDAVAVMYLGEIVESGTRDDVLVSGAHPYTKSLLDAVPIPDPTIQRSRKFATLPGDPPDPLDPPTGCALHPRCPLSNERCSIENPKLRLLEGGEPALVERGGVSHLAACHRLEETTLLSGGEATSHP